MPGEEHFRKLERLYAKAPINRFYQPTLRIGEGRSELTIPVRPEFYHAARAVHGSVYFKALDDAAFFAVNSLLDDVFALTVSFNIYLTRPVSEGELRASGKVVSASRRLYVGEAVLFDSETREIGRGVGTFMRSRIALGPDVGYE